MGKPDNRVNGVDLGMVREDLLTAELERRKLPTTGAAALKVRRLATFFGQFPDKDLNVCDCGGESTEDCKACPFCGDSGASEESAPDTKPEVGDVLEKAGKPPQKLVKVAPKPKAAVAKPDKTDTKPADVQLLAPSGAVALTEGESVLDSSVRRIKELRYDYMRSSWELGQAIVDNYEGQLWKLRTKDGKPAYQTVKQFWAEELGFSPPWAYMMMDIAKVFTREEVAEIGPTKLGLVLKAPVEKRRALLEQARKGASKRQLQDKLTEIKVKDRAVAAGKADKPERVTVAFIPGRTTLKMWARVPGANPKKADPKRAKKVTDNPWCDEVMSNDVRVLYRLVVDSSGELSLVVERRRMDKAEKGGDEAP